MVAWLRKTWRRQAGEGGRGWAVDLACKSASGTSELSNLGKVLNILEPWLFPCEMQYKTNLRGSY